MVKRQSQQEVIARGKGDLLIYCPHRSVSQDREQSGKGKVQMEKSR